MGRDIKRRCMMVVLTLISAIFLMSPELTSANPTIVTTPNPSIGSIPTVLNDSAALSGGVNPTGTITFNLYGPNDQTCSGPPVFTNTVAVNGNGTYSTPTGFTTTQPGTYHWIACYSGDANNAPVCSNCADEAVVISAPKYIFTPIDKPGAYYTDAWGINDNGEIVGTYTPGPSQAAVGYKLSNGVFSDVWIGKSNYTANGINNNGEVLGQYVYNLDEQRAYVMREDGFHSIYYPTGIGSYAGGINDLGQIVGEYYDIDQKNHSFFFDGDQYYSFDCSDGSYPTTARGINNNQDIVGWCGNRGYLLRGGINGTFQYFEYPGAVQSAFYGINDNGDIIGAMSDGVVWKNFLLKGGIGGSLIPLDLQGVSEFICLGINNSRQIVGRYKDASGVNHGFIANPVTGPSELINEILEFFDQAVTDKSLIGSGPGKSANNRLNSLRNMIESAKNLIENELFAEACQQLTDAYKKTDGNPNPPDFVSGPSASILANKIQDLKANLGCQ